MSQMSEDFHSILYFVSLNYIQVEINRAGSSRRCRPSCP